MIHVCVPTLNRYDLLREMLLSLTWSTVPVQVCVIDNGGKLQTGDVDVFPGVQIVTPNIPMGLAESWNWFIAHVREERVIVNDDIEFAPNSLAAMTASTAPFVSCSFGFSCFILRDVCVERVGLFDETISPGYAYFEDMDYLRRMRLADVTDEVVLCDVKHKGSATPEKYSAAERDAHDQKFSLAQSNYIAKWAQNPSWEQLKTIGGAGANT